MATFFKRFIGAIALDAAAYEDVEADVSASMQSALVVLLACAAGGVAALGVGASSLGSFVTGAIIALGAWLVWVAIIAVVGTIMLREPQTRSSVSELLRTMGFAAAPGVFVAFAAMQAVTAIVILLVSLWMIVAAVIAMRQALDYRTTTRAVAVCVISWVIAAGVMGAVVAAMTPTVS